MGDLSYTNTLGTNVACDRPRPGPVDPDRHVRPDRVGNGAQRALHGLGRPEPGRRRKRAVCRTGRGINVDHPAVVEDQGDQHGHGARRRTSSTAARMLRPSTPAVGLHRAGYDGPAQLLPGASPFYLVPSETTAIAATASTTGTRTHPVRSGRADRVIPTSSSGQGLSVSAGVTGNPVTAGRVGHRPRRGRPVRHDWGRHRRPWTPP